MNAPATVSLISSQTIANAPAQTYADLLRSVPGVNVTQTSARDINITSRGASSTLSTSQLALMDGRSLYQDFFGFVAWDFLPVNLNEIKQIEVIRGPASAVWGANAMTGVINVITKSPREIAGGSFSLSAGDVRPRRERVGREGRLRCSRSAGLVGAGGQRSLGVQGVGRRVDAGRVRAPDRRPSPTASTRRIPPSRTRARRSRSSTCASTTTIPDGRQKIVFGGGIAGTEGMIHTGIGPFDMQSGTTMSVREGQLQPRAR